MNLTGEKQVVTKILKINKKGVGVTNKLGGGGMRRKREDFRGGGLLIRYLRVL